MSTTLIVIICATLIIVYLIFLKDGQFKEGLGKFLKKDYSGANENFYKAIKKNPNHFKAYFYLGLSLLERYKQNEKGFSDFKKSAFTYFILSSRSNHNFLEPNNHIKFLINSERDLEAKTEMICYTKELLKNSNQEVIEQYSWINNM